MTGTWSRSQPPAAGAGKPMSLLHVAVSGSASRMVPAGMNSNSDIPEQPGHSVSLNEEPDSSLLPKK